MGVPDHLAVRDLEIVTRGELPPDTREYAAAKLRSVLRYAPDPVLHARAKVTRHGDPAVHRAVVAQFNVNLGGRLVRVQAEGVTAHEAIDEAQAELRRRLPEFARHWEARRGGMPVTAPHEWRHDSVPTARSAYFPRPVEDRQVVRHKTFTLAGEGVDDAVAEMNQLDYDFHLFTESGTGQDSVVYRAGATGYRLAQAKPRPQRLAPCRTPLTFSERPAPRLSVPEAVERLNLTGLPFVFFAAADTGRGCILYHRYDGHYGLITPAA